VQQRALYLAWWKDKENPLPWEIPDPTKMKLLEQPIAGLHAVCPHPPTRIMSRLGGIHDNYLLIAALNSPVVGKVAFASPVRSFETDKAGKMTATGEAYLSYPYGSSPLRKQRFFGDAHIHTHTHTHTHTHARSPGEKRPLVLSPRTIRGTFSTRHTAHDTFSRTRHTTLDSFSPTSPPDRVHASPAPSPMYLDALVAQKSTRAEKDEGELLPVLDRRGGGGGWRRGGGLTPLTERSCGSSPKSSAGNVGSIASRERERERDRHADRERLAMLSPQ